MSKMVIETEEYSKLKNKINKLSDTNKTLKEKYVQLQKRTSVDTGVSVEKFDKLKVENDNLKKDITLRKQENNKLKEDKRKLLYDIALFKKENDTLKTNVNNLTNKNKELNSMIEEFENRKKTKNELNHKPNSTQNSKKKTEFDMNDFNKEYEEFVKKLKENSQNETI